MTVISRDQIEFRLIKRVEDFERGYRQNIALIGRRGSGKTLLAAKLLDFIRSREKILAVSIQLSEIAPAHLAAFWIGRILSSALNLAESDISSLLGAAESRLPKTCKAARHILKLHRQGNTALAVRELFALSGQLAEETGKKIVLILDELLGLENFLIHDVYSILGNRLMMEKEVLFVVTSSHPRRAREIFSEKLALLFSNFEVLEMQPLDFDEMNQMIDARACRSYISLPARRFLFRLTNGEFRYLETILQVLDDSVCADPKRQLGVAALFESVIREVLNKDGRISLEFQKTITAFRKTAKERANLIAEAVSAVGSAGRMRSSGLASALGIKVTEAKKLIARMEEEDWLITSGAWIALRDPLFRFWAAEYLAPACEGRFQNEQALRAHWTRKLGEIYEVGLTSDSGRVADRLEAALKMFRVEPLLIDGRRIPGAHFSELTWSSTTENHRLLRGQTAKDTRFFLVCLTEVCEQSVEILRATVGSPRKPVRRVILAAGGMDQNARLLAQQNRIEIWELNFFNRMLDFFALAKVIMERRKPVWDDEFLPAGAPGLFSLAAS